MAKRKKDYDELTISQLNTLEEDLLKEQRELRFNMVVSTVENPARVKEIRRDIARVKTIIREMELGIREKKEMK
jgi:large subunit ribosomal protein L29